jgi:hypothetical protein
MLISFFPQNSSSKIFLYLRFASGESVIVLRAFQLIGFASPNEVELTATHLFAVIAFGDFTNPEFSLFQRPSDPTFSSTERRICRNGPCESKK